MPELDARVRSAAPPERVWALLADVTTWPRWADFDEASVESGSGLGELRAFRRGRTRTSERVTVFEPPRRLGYDLVSGIPIRDYHADVTLTPENGGTDIRWHSTFKTKVPGTGWLIRHSLQRFVADTAERLARAAEQR
jgi:uncharacterized protein YndB with AHSA1/START domain